MENEEKEILKVARLCQYNSQSEAGAIKDYTEFLSIVAESELKQDLKDEIITIIEELIADELNHQKKLDELYVELTDIQPKKD